MEDEKSKSQKKRDADALQKLGVQLTGLSREKLDRLPLSPQLMQAIIEAKALKSHGAIRRQAQLIGKLMRSADHEAIYQAYEQLCAEDSAKTAEFHVLEQWRDRLINEGKSALTELIAQYQLTETQHLRQLIKKAQDEAKHVVEPKMTARRALFRFLRDSLL